MNWLKLIWRHLSDWFGFNVPPEVSKNMPRNLDEYRERRVLNERLAEIARRCHREAQ